jgi:hypothetical protein
MSFFFFSLPLWIYLCGWVGISVIVAVELAAAQRTQDDLHEEQQYADVQKTLDQHRCLLESITVRLDDLHAQQCLKTTEDSKKEQLWPEWVADIPGLEDL